MSNLKWSVCDNCKVKTLVSSYGNGNKYKCPYGSRCWEYSYANNMDVGEIPEELQGLTFIEEQLIARIHPMIVVYKLKGHQYGYKGNIISFPQDVQELALQLPHKIKDLNSIVCIKYQNRSDKYHEFNIRSGRVRRSLEWLKKHNPFYKNIVLSEENLNLLPEEGNVSSEIESICIPSEEETFEQQSSNDSSPESQKEDENFIMESGISQIQISNQDDLIKQKLKWPSMSTEPVNELRTPGYIACAYPTLFPFGTADLRDERIKEVKTADYFRHLLSYHDNRFAKHPTFRFFAYNSWLRWTALSDGNVFVRNNPEFKDMTVSELKEKIDENQNIMKQIMFQSSNLKGTKAYWHTRANELRDMVDQLGLPTIFLTLSCADGHWNDLYKLLSDVDVSLLTEKDRRQLIQDFPHVVDSFFDYRVKSFIKNVSIIDLDMCLHLLFKCNNTNNFIFILIFTGFGEKV